MNPEYNFIGVDYGSKLAGTTTIAWVEHEILKVVQSDKKRDADQFIKEFVVKLKPERIFIDAPLSLPGKYSGKGDDFFYRKADRVVKAMSPMFIGGLTARAMKLKEELEHYGISFIEAYPSYLVQTQMKQYLDLYKQKGTEESFIHALTDKLPAKPMDSGWNWHMIDSVLAWYTGYRYLNGLHKAYGDPKEGVIIV